jgi:hypothetical protein
MKTFQLNYFQLCPLHMSMISEWECYPRATSTLLDDVQHYVIKFVSNVRRVGGFLRVHRFPPPIKLTATI